MKNSSNIEKFKSFVDTEEDSFLETSDDGGENPSAAQKFLSNTFDNPER